MRPGASPTTRRTGCPAPAGRTPRGRRFGREGAALGVISVSGRSSIHVEVPFGGYKQPGFGRELGLETLEFHTETNNLSVDIS